MVSAEVIISLIWCHSSLFLGLLGNTYVLHATIAHRAIKLDKLSVWIIQNLAVTDLVNSVIVLVPVLISLHADSRWVLGDTFCQISFGYKYLGIVANMVLINILSFNKLIRCLFPLRTLDCSRARRWSVTVVTVITMLITPSWHFYKSTLKTTNLIHFSRSQCMCWLLQNSTPQIWHLVLDYLLSGMLNALPCLTLIGLNAYLVIFAVRKSTRSVNKMNIMVVVLITASFLVATLPYFIYFVIRGDVWTDGDVILRFVTFVFFLAFWFNPVIYLATNKNFWNYTVRFIRRESNRVSASQRPVAVQDSVRHGCVVRTNVSPVSESTAS